MIAALHLCDAARIPVLTEAETARLLPAFDVSERLGEPDVRTTRTPALMPEAEHLRARATLRIDHEDPDGAGGTVSRREWWDLWRVEEPEGEPVASGAEIVCEWRPYWLVASESVAVPRTGAGAETDDLQFFLTDRTPEDAMGVLFDPDNGAPALASGNALFEAGAVHALYASRGVEVTATAATTLDVLAAMCESLGCEWRARVVTSGLNKFGTGDTYAVDLVPPASERGLFEPGIEEGDLVLDLTLLARQDDGPYGPRYGPAVSLVRSEDGQDAVATVFPLSEVGEDGEAKGVAGAEWAPGYAVHDSGETYVELHRSRVGDSPPPALAVWEDDALIGAALQEVGGQRRTFEIVDTAYPNRLLVTGDASDLDPSVRIVSDGDPRQRLRSLTSPTLSALWGRAERAMRFASHPLPNLFAREGVSADLSAWDGEDPARPYGVETAGTVTMTRTTAPEDVKRGPASALVTFPGGLALTGDDLDVSVTLPRGGGSQDDTATETATYAPGGSLATVGFTASATAETATYAAKGGTAEATATLTMEFLDSGSGVLATHAASLTDTASGALTVTADAPSGTEAVRVTTVADALTGETSGQFASASASVSGAALERDDEAGTPPAVLIGSGALRNTAAVWLAVRMIAGAVSVRIEDALGVVQSNSEGTLEVEASGTDDVFAEITLAWSEVPSAHRLVIRPVTPGASFALDAVTAVPGTVPAPFRPAMGPEALWEMAAFELSRRRADGLAAALSAFEGEAFDLAALGLSPEAPVSVGQAVRVRGAFTAYTGEVRARVLAVEYRDGVGAASSDRRFSLGTLGPDLQTVIEEAAEGTVTAVASGASLLATGGGFTRTASAPGQSTVGTYGDATLTQGTTYEVTLRPEAGGATVEIPTVILGPAGIAAANILHNTRKGLFTIRLREE